MIDLRSDTVTRPTPAMKDFMFSAAVGDDVFHEDPTVIELEKKCAALFGKESGLFCPSGTMTNQIALKVLSSTPGEIICDELSHVYQYEGGGIAFNSGLSVRLLQGDRGRIDKALVEQAINPDDVHKPESQVVSVENTANRGGGSVYAMNTLKELSEFSHGRKLFFHLDGARIFNAIVASDYMASDIGPLFDTVSVCLSKGLGCPVGSVLVGNKELIKKARRIRKVLGGGMRQAGYLAAAGIYALDHHIERLTEDHQRAKEIEKKLQTLSYVEGMLPVETNIVVFKLIPEISTQDFLTTLKSKGILAVAFGPQQIRFVTHLDFNDDHLTTLLDVLGTVY